MKLWNFLKESILRNPGQVVCENGAEMSFEELVIWAEMFGKKLNGIRCCAILCNSEMAAAMALLGCLAAGVTAVPLSMRYGENHCNKILDAISPNAIITDVGGEFHIQKVPHNHYTPPEEHPALIMCTSGTTGKPKGAMLSEENILTNLIDITAYFAIDENDTILIARPLYHCAVLTGEFLTALVKGTRIRFYSESFNPTRMLELIREYKITAFCGTPTLLGMTARIKRGKAGDTLKHICISGECMGRDLGLRIADAFPQCSIYHVYGLTEACPRVSYLPPGHFREYPQSVGIPLRSVSVKILQKDGTPASVGQEGVLWIKGKNIMLGYYQDPEKTATVLKDGWLCTGDMAIINSAGFLEIRGRNDHLIVKAGMNIYPAEIEAAVKTDPRVREVLAYGFQSQYGTQIGMKIAGDFDSIEEVKQLCATILPLFQVPMRIQLVESLPKNGSGKIIRGDPHA